MRAAHTQVEAESLPRRYSFTIDTVFVHIRGARGIARRMDKEQRRTDHCAREVSWWFELCR